ncbi:MAG: carboxypeptidase regulatory-like domain-containing protein [candidate division Zixibacteria bacterium]|nr:carboxypeptidase regulatory-like domain-containing protein [candidate division Zixibacteria bacterium]
MKLNLTIVVLVFFPVFLSAQTADVYINYGSPAGEADTIDCPLYDRFDIPVYFQAAGNDTLRGEYLLSVLGINNAYISEFDTAACVYHYPLSQWDYAEFANLEQNFYTDNENNSWDCLSFMGLYELEPPYESVYFVLIPDEAPVHALTFSVLTEYILELEDSVVTNAIGYGDDPIQGPSNFGHTATPYEIEESFANFRFFTHDGAISGVVVNDGDEPVESVLVEIVDSRVSGYSNSVGEFFLPYLADDLFDIYLSHPDYSDTLVNDIEVSLSDTVTLEVNLKYGGAITGIVTDGYSNPIAEAYLEIPYHDLSDTTDIDGRYIIGGIHPGSYDFTFYVDDYRMVESNDIQITDTDTIVIDISTCRYEFDSEVDIMVWLGGQFNGCDIYDTTTIYPDMNLSIPVYFMTPADYPYADLCFPLGINNAYIDSFVTADCQYHFPFTQWDIAGFELFFDNYMTDDSANTWDSYAFKGLAEIIPPYDSPFLHTGLGESPIHGLTFVVHVRDDIELDGQTITDAIGLGYFAAGCDGQSFPPDCGDPMNFGNIYYIPGDANMLNGLWPPEVIGSDVTYLVNYFRDLESNGSCMLDGAFASADINGDCLVIGSDVTRLVNYFRGLSDISYCPDHPPTWPTPEDIPLDAPVGWPNCE